jgi:sugar phosphate isomerase/epimerase
MSGIEVGRRNQSRPTLPGRREFLKTASLATSLALGARFAWALPADDPYFQRIGLQLWTVRNQLAESAPRTLAAIARAGYHQVELMDVSTADTLVPLAKDAGLQVTSSFINWEVLGRDQGATGKVGIEQTVEQAQRHGLKHLVFGYIGKGHREKAAQLQRTAERCNRAAELCAKAGMQLGYHNHSFEFEPLAGGQTGYEILIEEFDPQLMKFEVDVFWVACGGWDPVETMRRLNGRVSQLHLKDMLAGTAKNFDEGTIPPDAFQELGAGTIDLPGILKAAQGIGVAQCHVEQDQSPDPLQSIAASYQYLKQL